MTFKELIGRIAEIIILLLMATAIVGSIYSIITYKDPTIEFSSTNYSDVREFIRENCKGSHHIIDKNGIVTVKCDK